LKGKGGLCLHKFCIDAKSGINLVCRGVEDIMKKKDVVKLELKDGEVHFVLRECIVVGEPRECVCLDEAEVKRKRALLLLRGE